MTFTSWPLFAQAAEGVTRTTFEWGRIQENSDWILPIGVCVAILLLVRHMYRRDAAELHPVLSWFLTALRTATFLGLLILYLQPQWRVEHEVVRNSRAMLLVDASLSMGLTDADSPAAGTGKSRIEQVAAALAESDLLEQLRKTHDVVVLRFNDNLDRDHKTLDKLTPPSASAADQQPGGDVSARAAALTDDPKTTPEAPVDWPKFLAPGGTETRLGMALRQVVNEESGKPLSGIIVFTDGGQNAGIAPEAAIDLAKKNEVPIFPVGIGSARKPPNVRVSDLVAPARAYPGDSYVVTGFVQAQGLDRPVTLQVQLLSRESGSGQPAGDPGSGDVEFTQQVPLGEDGQAEPVKIELTPEEPGRRTLCFRIQAPKGDRNPGDDYREVDIEIVERKNHVLLFAGGPTREYRFVRTLLYRDRSTTLHVLLQTIDPGQTGISQEADEILDEFPTSREEMFRYDCVLAFDPDWQTLSAEKVGLLEAWVGEQGGGLVLIAGPVFAGQAVSGWTESKDDAMAKIRALYPVEFRRSSVVDDGVYTTEEPWPLDFTREGLEAEFLWLDDTPAAGREAWAGFEGVYSFCPVHSPKPGATVLARFSDPRSGHTGRVPVFFASQFYGSGRVFYLGSGEMWRLRKLDEAYFEQFYTKLLRHVSQGRLLRGSSRGVLLVGQERYLLGDTVEIRTQLTNARLEPLDMPKVDLQVIRPDSSVQTVTLQPDPGRVGTYTGRFPVLAEGSYRLELPVPEGEPERLTRRIQVKVPDLERENPQRNDALLSRIAESTGGTYYVGLSKVTDTNDSESVVKQLKDRTKTIIMTASPDKDWERNWFMWMMIALCGVLCLEWLIRRLAKLA